MKDAPGYVPSPVAKTPAASPPTAPAAKASRKKLPAAGRVVQLDDPEPWPDRSHADALALYVAHTAKMNRSSYKDQAVLDRLVKSTGDRLLTEVSPFQIERWKRERADTVSQSGAQYRPGLFLAGGGVGPTRRVAASDGQAVSGGRCPVARLLADRHQDAARRRAD